MISKTIYIMNVAKVAHEVNKAYCESIGDHSQVSWEEAEDWQKSSSVAGVRMIFDGEITGPGDSHRSWMQVKLDEGWKYGPIKDPSIKEHPCMVPFNDLPQEQQSKDHIFFALVSNLKLLEE